MIKMELDMQNINKVYTYSDYLNFPENEKWEIIDGIPFKMEAPSWEHQFISSELVTLLNTQLRGTPCRAVAAAFDLRLPKKNEKDEDISTVVQPDINDKIKLKALENVEIDLDAVFSSIV